MRRLAVGGAILLSAATARAQSPAPAQAAQATTGLMPVGSGVERANDPTLRAVVPERRNGVVMGVAAGPAAGGANGYPNSAKFFGNPDFYSASPLLVGWAASFFFMGALSDYVSVGPTFSLATFESDKWKSTGWGLGFRGEVYPFVSAVPALADASIYSQVGVGSTELRAKGPYPDADGTQSFLGLGVHHEWRLGRLLGGHAAAGPYAEYDLIHARSIDRHTLSLGIRVVWYGAGVKLDGR